MPQGPSNAPSPDPAAALARACVALHDGGFVLAPCESAYLLIASADSASGLAGLGAATGAGSRPAPAWLCHSPERLAQVWPDLPALARRLSKRLTPGPLGLSIEGSEVALGRVRHALRVGEQAVDSGDSLHVRIPGASPAADLCAVPGPTLACVEVLEPQGGLALEADAAARSLASIGLAPDVRIDAGPVAQRAGATLAHIGPRGLNILRPGAYEERFIRKHAQATILFVCTGNTCRSPMAVAIAEGLLAQRGVGPDRVKVSSAGVGAGTGSPASPETREAVASLGLRMGRHASRPAQRADIEEADLVFTMTRGHRASVLALAPGASARVFTLDPADADVPDPIGAGQETYNQTARRLRDLIDRRLGELTL